MEAVLRKLYVPDESTWDEYWEGRGSGVAGHIHMHVLPRWVADANFLSVVGETRVLPETLDVTWERIKNAFVDGGAV